MFQERVTYFKEQYNTDTHNFNPTVGTEITRGRGSGQGNINFFGQVYYIFKRTLIGQIRNPLDIIMKILQMVIQGAFCAILYYKGSDSAFASIQNVTGCLSFLMMATAFTGIISHIATFST